LKAAAAAIKEELVADVANRKGKRPLFVKE
jgi:hypothetical protein